MWTQSIAAIAKPPLSPKWTFAEEFMHLLYPLRDLLPEVSLLANLLRQAGCSGQIDLWEERVLSSRLYLDGRYGANGKLWCDFLKGDDRIDEAGLDQQTPYEPADIG